MNMRQALLAAMRGDPEIISEALRERMDGEGPMGTVAQAAVALEPVLADAVKKRPSRLGKLGLKSAHMLATLTVDDEKSSSALAKMAHGGTVGIVFADVAGFTRFTAEHGDEEAIAALTRLRQIVDTAIKPTQGACVKSLGDGFLLAFPSASQALRGAVSLQTAVKRERRKDPGFWVHLRVAVHAGEPSVSQDDLLGHDVNLTARLLDHCDPDRVLVSEAAKELAERRLKKIAFGAQRVIKIRGLATRVTAYEVSAPVG